MRRDRPTRSVVRSSTVSPAVGTAARRSTVTVAGQMSGLPFRIAARPPETTTGTIGRLRLDRHDEAALLERQQLSGPAARALRKDDEGIARPKRLGGPLDRRPALVGIRRARAARSPATSNTQTRTGSLRSSAL